MSQREVEHFVDGEPAAACIRCQSVFTPEREFMHFQVDTTPSNPTAIDLLPLDFEEKVADCCFDCLQYVRSAIARLFDSARQPGAPQPMTEPERRLLAGVALVDSQVWLSSLRQEWMPARAIEDAARAVLVFRRVEVPEVAADDASDPRHPGRLEAELLKLSSASRP